MKAALLATVLLVLVAPPASARVLALPSGTIHVEATGPDGAQYVFDDTSLTCSPPSGSVFPIGATTVDCGADGSFVVNVSDTTAPLLSLSDLTVEATSASGASVAFAASSSDAVGVTDLHCDHPSGDTFPLGTTAVGCTAKDAANNAGAGSFNVTVRDTTPPDISNPGEIDVITTSPAGATVDFPTPTATDLGQALAVTCHHDSTFPVGTTAVTCDAGDGRGNTSSVTFNVVVTLVDSTAPVLHDVPSAIAQSTDAAAGTIVGFAPTATDNVDGNDPVVCSPSPPYLFPVGTTHVTCSATDAHGNTSSAGFDVVITLVDVTKPVLHGVPGSIDETTESPGGKAVTFSPPTASDNIDGPVGVTCDHASGSTFPLGTTTVTCSATDAHHNTQQASFTVTLTLIDVTAPVLSGVSLDRFVEANGPSGASVSFGTPTATDNLDGPLALVACDPPSGTRFSLGTHLVTCKATDAHANVGSASFRVTVGDTTPPTLAVPGPTSVYATTPLGIPETAPGLLGFRAAVTARDIVDPHPTISDNLGSFAEVGTHSVVFAARDGSGNVAAKQTQLTVLPQPAAGTQPLPVPPPAKVPADVSNLQIVPGDGVVRLVWGAVPGAAEYLVYRSQSGSRRLAAGGHGELVYRGTATTYTDRAVTNGVEYRYVVVSQDAAGNASAGVAAAAMPRVDLLRSPKDGARLKKAPKLTWARNGEASYYNVQLFRGETKILSTWPVGASLKLKGAWKYDGQRFKLTKGAYRWYVWPGFGARPAVDYGELLGSRSFEIVR